MPQFYLKICIFFICKTKHFKISKYFFWTKKKKKKTAQCMNVSYFLLGLKLILDKREKNICRDPGLLE